MSRVPPIEGLLRRFSSNRFIADMTERLAFGRADVAVTSLARVHAPVIILFRFSGLNHQILTAAVTEVHAVLSRAVIVE